MAVPGEAFFVCEVSHAVVQESRQVVLSLGLPGAALKSLTESSIAVGIQFAHQCDNEVVFRDQLLVRLPVCADLGQVDLDRSLEP